jgi:nucleoside-diphosphate-sugar epimerase
MVLGNGLVASGFKVYMNDEKCLVFASGVSDSANTDAGVFKREEDLLIKAISEHPEKTFIYFGTCSVYDPSLLSSPYVVHKLAMEAIVKQLHGDYHIFRISNLAGKTNNPHTVLNFFVQHIISGQFFPLWENASRNIIDMDDVTVACHYIIQQRLFKNEVVNVANPFNYPVTQIVQTIEDTLGLKGNYELVDKGSDPLITTHNIQKIFTELNIRFDETYLKRIVKKYFAVK